MEICKNLSSAAKHRMEAPLYPRKARLHLCPRHQPALGQRENPSRHLEGFLEEVYGKSRPRPSFPPVGSIIGAGELGFRVRDGNGHVLPAMAAGIVSSGWKTDAVSGGNGNMAKPHGLLVPLGCARRRACTCGLSTRYSPGGLQGDHVPRDA